MRRVRDGQRSRTAPRPIAEAVAANPDCDSDHRRRRLRCCREQVRPGRQDDASSPRAVAPPWSSSRARPFREWRLSMTQSKRTRLIAGNWKMNNDDPGSCRARPGARRRAARDPRGRRGRACARRPSTSVHVSCKGGIKASPHQARRPERLLGGRWRLHRRDLRSTCSRACPLITASSATPSAATTSTRPTRTRTRRPRRSSRPASSRSSAAASPLEAREAGEHVAFVTGQIKAGLAGRRDRRSGDELVIAYEPIWAIGTGKTATADDAQEVCGAIRATLDRDLRRGDRCRHPRALRRLRQAREHRRLPREGGRRRRPRGRRLAQGAISFAAMVEKAGE